MQATRQGGIARVDPMRVTALVAAVAVLVLSVLPIRHAVAQSGGGTSATVSADVLVDGGSVARVRASLEDAWSRARSWVERNYRRAPALMIGLVAVIVLPLLAVVGLLVRRLMLSARRAESTFHSTEAVSVVGNGGTGHSDAVASVRLRDGLTWPVDAWIEIEGQPETRRAIVHDLMRIGREADNEIVLTDARVHRYHAAVRRTEDAELLAIDLSPRDGNGLLVNGEQVGECRLRDGDIITIGRTRLLFSARRN